MRGHYLKHVYDGFIDWMNKIGSAWVFFLMLVITGDVGGRYIFNQPITGTPEIAKISLVAILFLGITHTLRIGKHVRGTFLVEWVSPKWAAVLNMVADFCGIILFALLCYSSWRLTWKAWQILEFEGEGALRVPTFPLRTLIIISSILMLTQFLLNFVNDYREWIKSKG